MLPERWKKYVDSGGEYVEDWHAQVSVWQLWFSKKKNQSRTCLNHLVLLMRMGTEARSVQISNCWGRRCSFKTVILYVTSKMTNLREIRLWCFPQSYFVMRSKKE
jgi:hypothetical protein